MYRLGPALLAIPFFTACGPPTFTEVRDDIFIPSCGLASTCHEGDAGDLQISAETASGIHSELVEVESTDAPGEILVIPGDSLNSYLMKKLRAEAGIEGDPMPPGPARLPDDQIQLVADWIDNGAPND